MTENPPEFALVRRGYARAEVERFLLGADGGPLGPPPRFTVAAKGYDPGEVDAYLTSLRAPRHDADAPAGPSGVAAGAGAVPATTATDPPPRRWWRRPRH